MYCDRSLFRRDHTHNGRFLSILRSRKVFVCCGTVLLPPERKRRTDIPSYMLNQISREYRCVSGRPSALGRKWPLTGNLGGAKRDIRTKPLLKILTRLSSRGVSRPFPRLIWAKLGARLSCHVAGECAASVPSAKKKGRPYPVSPCFYWYAVQESNL